MMGNVAYYIRNGMLKSPCHYQFVLGVLGGLEGTVENLLFLKKRLPEGATWSVTGIGRDHMAMMLAGLALGCDGLRVGLEDNLYLSRGVKATNVHLLCHGVRNLVLQDLSGQALERAKLLVRQGLDFMEEHGAVHLQELGGRTFVAVAHLHGVEDSVPLQRVLAPFQRKTVEVRGIRALQADAL